MWPPYGAVTKAAVPGVAPRHPGFFVTFQRCQIACHQIACIARIARIARIVQNDRSIARHPAKKPRVSQTAAASSMVRSLPPIELSRLAWPELPASLMTHSHHTSETLSTTDEAQSLDGGEKSTTAGVPNSAREARSSDDDENFIIVGVP